MLDRVNNELLRYLENYQCVPALSGKTLVAQQCPISLHSDHVGFRYGLLR